MAEQGKPTDGPWRLILTAQAVEVEGAGGRLVHYEDWGAIPTELDADQQEMLWQETMANARLIAKAWAIPELVEALRQLTEALVAIRDDQVSDDMFGGKSTPERVSNSQQYAAFIRQNASKLDSILPQAEAAIALVQDTD